MRVAQAQDLALDGADGEVAELRPTSAPAATHDLPRAGSVGEVA